MTAAPPPALDSAVLVTGASSGIGVGLAREPADRSYKPMLASGDLLLFCRELRDERVLIALNLGAAPIAFSVPDERSPGRVLISSFADREGEEVRARIDLRANEGLLVILASEASP